MEAACCIVGFLGLLLFERCLDGSLSGHWLNASYSSALPFAGLLLFSFYLVGGLTLGVEVGSAFRWFVGGIWMATSVRVVFAEENAADAAREFDGEGRHKGELK